MIVSHEHKFIFVHLKRTSGRAIQGALMPFLGPDDIATPVDDPNSPESFPGRNCEGLGRHATAREIRDYVGGDVWNEYFTFAMERNPWDKTLSRYWANVSKGRSYEALVTKITGKRIGFEFKYSEKPSTTKSMRIAEASKLRLHPAAPHGVNGRWPACLYNDVAAPLVASHWTCAPHPLP
jgi:hypothetical protein